MVKLELEIVEKKTKKKPFFSLNYYLNKSLHFLVTFEYIDEFIRTKV